MSAERFEGGNANAACRGERGEEREERGGERDRGGGEHTGSVLPTCGEDAHVHLNDTPQPEMNMNSMRRPTAIPIYCHGGL